MSPARTRMSSEHGQDTVEWAGVLVVVALVIAAVLVSGVPSAIARGVTCEAQKVFGACVYHRNPKVVVGCDRSGYAYNSTVSNRYAFEGGKQTWACSGSITKDIYDPGDPRCSAGHASGRYREGCQADRANADTSLITMSIGGNDAGFSDDLRSCYENRAKLHWSQSADRPGDPEPAPRARAAVAASLSGGLPAADVERLAGGDGDVRSARV